MLRYVLCFILFCGINTSYSMNLDEYNQASSIKNHVLSSIDAVYNRERDSTSDLFDRIMHTRHFISFYEDQIGWNRENVTKICVANEFDTANFVFGNLYTLGSNFFSNGDIDALIQIAITLAFINATLNIEGCYDILVLGKYLKSKYDPEKLEYELQNVANVYLNKLLDIIS